MRKYSLIVMILVSLSVQAQWSLDLQSRAQKGDVASIHQMGWSYENGLGLAQDYKQALDWYTKAATKGNAASMNQIGNLYYFGKGVVKNYSTALSWYKKAIDSKSYKGSEAYNSVGNIYREGGYGVNRNLEEALPYYIKAYELGHKYAPNGIGLIYHERKEFLKAMEWFRKGTERNCTSSISNIGACYYNGEGAPQDYSKAMEWYEKAARMGYDTAIRNLASMYRNGIGTPKDLSKAIFWYQKLADKGDVAAMYGIGYSYHNSEPTQDNYKKAMEWYLKAEAKGYTAAMNDIGLMYEKGRGVEQNYQKAYEWYTKAWGKAKNVASAEHLGEMYYNGWYVTKDYNKAFEYLKFSAENSRVIRPNAMRLLAACYRYGLGTNVDAEKEQYWLEQAAKHKDQKAMNIMKVTE